MRTLFRNEIWSNSPYLNNRSFVFYQYFIYFIWVMTLFQINHISNWYNCPKSKFIPQSNVKKTLNQIESTGVKIWSHMSNDHYYILLHFQQYLLGQNVRSWDINFISCMSSANCIWIDIVYQRSRLYHTNVKIAMFDGFVMRYLVTCTLTLIPFLFWKLAFVLWFCVFFIFCCVYPIFFQLSIWHTTLDYQ